LYFASTANKKELVEGLTRKAKQVERLIQALPDVEEPEVKVLTEFVLSIAIPAVGS
jgi:hypothetical protein